LTIRLFLGESPILSLLEKRKYKFETAIGMNGKIWINAKSIKDTIICCNVIKYAESYKCGDIDEIEFKALHRKLSN